MTVDGGGESAERLQRSIFELRRVRNPLLHQRLRIMDRQCAVEVPRQQQNSLLLARCCWHVNAGKAAHCVCCASWRAEAAGGIRDDIGAIRSGERRGLLPGHLPAAQVGGGVALPSRSWIVVEASVTAEKDACRPVAVGSRVASIHA